MSEKEAGGCAVAIVLAGFLFGAAALIIGMGTIIGWLWP